MALLNFTGFETGDLVEIPLTVSGSPVVQGTTKRTGDYALEATADFLVVLRGLAADGKVAEMGRTAATYYTFWLRVTTLPGSNSTLCSVRDSGGGTVCTVNLSTAGSINATGAGSSSSAGTVTLSTWHRIDLMVLSNGTSSIQMDGGAAQTFTANNVTQDRLYLGGTVGAGPTGVWHYDDVFIDDTAFTLATAVARLDVDGAGTDTGWTGAYTAVDEIPHNSDTDYINSTSTTAAETVTVESRASAGIAGPVLSIKQGAVAKEASSTTTLMGLRMRSGATTSDTTPADVGNTTYVLFARLHNVDPATSSSWQGAAVDAVEVGVVKGNDNSDVRVTSIWAMAAWYTSRSHPGFRQPYRQYTKRRAA
jgi:hypothetical protein